MSIFLIILILQVSFSLPCCTLNTKQGIIDISALSEKVYSVNLPYRKKYTGKFTVCKDLEESTCTNEKTPGPAPFVEWDEFGKDCAWVGSLEGCDIGSYRSANKTFEIFYPGKLSSEEPTKMIRNVHLTLICDENAGTPIASCEGEDEHGSPVSEITHRCSIRSASACPKKTIEWAFIGAALGACFIAICTFFLYLFGVCLLGGIILFLITCGSSTFGMCCLLRAGYRQLNDDEEFEDEYDMKEFDGEGEEAMLGDEGIDYDEPEDNITINRDIEGEEVEEETGDIEL